MFAADDFAKVENIKSSGAQQATPSPPFCSGHRGSSPSNSPPPRLLSLRRLHHLDQGELLFEIPHFALYFVPRRRIPIELLSGRRVPQHRRGSGHAQPAPSPWLDAGEQEASPRASPVPNRRQKGPPGVSPPCTVAAAG